MKSIQHLLGGTFTVLHPSEGGDIKYEHTPETLLAFMAEGALQDVAFVPSKDISKEIKGCEDYSQLKKEELDGDYNDTFNEWWMEKMENIEPKNVYPTWLCCIFWGVEYDVNLTWLDLRQITEGDLSTLLTSGEHWQIELAKYVGEYRKEELDGISFKFPTKDGQHVEIGWCMARQEDDRMLTVVEKSVEGLIKKLREAKLEEMENTAL
jgi:hypothetical protein